MTGLQEREFNPGYAALARVLLKRGSVDLLAYKERQMIRRLEGYIRREGYGSLTDLARRIERDDEAFDRLRAFLTINVSEFFRNPEQYEYLAKNVLPRLLEEFGSLRIWSAGCSIGAEPYSVAMLLDELDPHGRHEILGTDVDEWVLETARQGEYSEKLLVSVTPERKARYFTRVGEERWAVIPEIRRRVRFAVHDLLRDSYPQRQHLILCRNVVIYFKDDAKREIFRRFSESLVPGGVLMLGATESVLHAREIGLRSPTPFFYVKEASHECVG